MVWIIAEAGICVTQEYELENPEPGALTPMFINVDDAPMVIQKGFISINSLVYI